MPIKKVNPKVDFVKQEHEILDFWEKHDIFQKRVELNRGKPRWSFLDGPITANNPMGVHHAWGRTIKDIVQRFKAMTGHELRYQNGFDCQGLWVEIEVEKELGITSKKDVEKIGIEKFVDLCKKRVLKYAGIQTDQSIRLGYWMDWDNSYFTMSEENNYTIWRFLKKLFEEGKIYRGIDSVPWSGRNGTSYSQMEIIEGRKLVAHDAIFIKFPLKNRDRENLLVWTTTPWTVPANVAAAVNPNLEYVKLKAADGEIFYFAQENLTYQRLEKQYQDKKQWVDDVPKLKTIEQIFKEHGGYEIVDSLTGADMIGWEYKGPFDQFEAQGIAGGHPYIKENLEAKGVTGIQCHRIIDGGKDSMGNDVVVAGEGTGIVHIAPGCGDIDHQIGKKLGLVDIAPLNEESKFISGFGWLTGKLATDPDVKDDIIADLKQRDLLVHKEAYPHVYPHCWRSGDELVFRLVEEWYINMDWRDKIKKVVDDIEWIPEWGRDREHEWLDNMGDWMISKKRFWGLALPIWTFEDGSYHVVGSKEELKELAVEGWEEFEGHTPHRPWIDKIKIKHPETGLIGTRIPDVGNPWLDAGIVPFSTMKYLSDHEYWKKWYPADFVTECFPGQFRNWFYSLLAMSAWLEETAPFKTLLGHALVKDEQGREMHKSWGNAIWFDDAAEKMGVDVMRWMYAAQNVEHHLHFGYGPANDVRKKIITLWNAYSFLATYAAVDGFDPTGSSVSVSDLSLLDKWILSRIHQLLRDTEKAYETYRFDRVMRMVERFIEDLSNWYIRRSRRRFWKSDNDQDKLAAYQTLYEVMIKLIQLVAPVLPFVSEAIWQNLARNADSKAAESVHHCDFPEYDAARIDDTLMQQMSTLKTLVENGRSARNQAGLKIRQPLAVLKFSVRHKGLAEFILSHQDVILDELNVKSIVHEPDTADLIDYQVKPNLAKLGQKYGKDLPLIRTLLEEKEGQNIVEVMETNGEVELNQDGHSFVLTREDILVEKVSADGYTSVSENGITVGLSTELTDDLIREGLVRDVIRQVQIMRKNANFAVEDRIKIYGSFPGEIGKAMEQFKDYFCAETLTTQMEDTFHSGEFSDSFTVGDETVTLGLERHPARK